MARADRWPRRFASTGQVLGLPELPNLAAAAGLAVPGSGPRQTSCRTIAGDGTSLPIATPETPRASLDALIRSGGGLPAGMSPDAGQQGCRMACQRSARRRACPSRCRRAGWGGEGDSPVRGIGECRGSVSRQGNRAAGPAASDPVTSSGAAKWDMAATKRQRRPARLFLGCPGRRRPIRGADARLRFTRTAAGRAGVAHPTGLESAGQTARLEPGRRSQPRGATWPRQSGRLRRPAAPRYAGTYAGAGNGS